MYSLFLGFTALQNDQLTLEFYNDLHMLKTAVSTYVMEIRTIFICGYRTRSCSAVKDYGGLVKWHCRFSFNTHDFTSIIKLTWFLLKVDQLIIQTKLLYHKTYIKLTHYRFSRMYLCVKNIAI